MLKRLMVTGKLGFIGNNFINRILKNYNYKILNLDSPIIVKDSGIR